LAWGLWLLWRGGWGGYIPIKICPYRVILVLFYIDFFRGKGILKVAGAISLAGGLGSRSSPSASGAIIGLLHEGFTLPLPTQITAVSSQ